MRPEEASEIRDLSDLPAGQRGRDHDPGLRGGEPDARAPATPSPRSAASSRRPRRSTTSTSWTRSGGCSGVLSLYRLILSPGATRVANLMAPTTVRVRADADREVAARLLTDRNLLAIPVVDDDDHLLGIITQDDVADVLEAEATEDIERLGGSEPLNVPYRSSSVMLLVRKRVGVAPAPVRGRGLHRHRAPRLPGRARARSCRSPSSSRC